VRHRGSSIFAEQVAKGRAGLLLESRKSGPAIVLNNVGLRNAVEESLSYLHTAHRMRGTKLFSTLNK
jgi:hypothetical protein